MKKLLIIILKKVVKFINSRSILLLMTIKKNYYTGIKLNKRVADKIDNIIEENPNYFFTTRTQVVVEALRHYFTDVIEGEK